VIFFFAGLGGLGGVSSFALEKGHAIKIKS